MFLTTTSVLVSAFIALNSGNLDVYNAQFAVSLVGTPSWMFLTGRSLVRLYLSLHHRYFVWKAQVPQLFAVVVFVLWLTLCIEAVVPVSTSTARMFSQSSCAKDDATQPAP
jgi:hypothetical protein